MWIEYENKIYDIGNMYNMRTLPMTYDFYLKNKMSAFEWKLNAMINKDRNLLNNIPKNWRHPINTEFNCYRF